MYEAETVIIIVVCHMVFSVILLTNGFPRPKTSLKFNHVVGGWVGKILKLELTVRFSVTS